MAQADPGRSPPTAWGPVGPGPATLPEPASRVSGPTNVMKLNKFLELDCCLSLGLNPKWNRFGRLCRLGRRGVGEKC